MADGQAACGGADDEPAVGVAADDRAGAGALDRRPGRGHVVREAGERQLDGVDLHPEPSQLAHHPVPRPRPVPCPVHQHHAHRDPRQPEATVAVAAGASRVSVSDTPAPRAIRVDVHGRHIGCVVGDRQEALLVAAERTFELGGVGHVGERELDVVVSQEQHDRGELERRERHGVGDSHAPARIERPERHIVEQRAQRRQARAPGGSPRPSLRCWPR